MTALLEIENVTAGYGSGPDILVGLTLRIEPNRSYCLNSGVMSLHGCS